MQRCLIYVGTRDGVFVLLFDGRERLDLLGRGLTGQAVRAIAVHPAPPHHAYIGCGLGGWGLHRTRDGRTFEPVGFEDRWVWDVVFHPSDPRTLWVGTEPPMLYVTRDEGRTFEALDGIERLPSRPSWKFFHPPFHAGHIHGLAVHPDVPDRIFAGVEHGAFIYSDDGGRTWQEALLGFDIHRVAVDPLDPARIFAGAGEGLFISRDAGRTWEDRDALRGKYVHAIQFDPRRPSTVYVYVAEDGSPLYKSDDGGGTWRQIGEGLPAARPADSLSLHPEVSSIIFYGGDIDETTGRVFVSFDGGEQWEPLPMELPKIWRLRTAPAPEAGVPDGISPLVA